MSVRVAIHDGPLSDAQPLSRDGRSGAVVLFEGVVRGEEAGASIAGLAYEAYEPMASRMLAELAQAILDEFAVHAIEVDHSRGLIPVGAASFRLRVSAAHRREALAADDAFIERMKRDVPLWKTPVST
jgi:molybdopterin synthase catalytic subunit